MGAVTLAFGWGLLRGYGWTKWLGHGLMLVFATLTVWGLSSAVLALRTAGSSSWTDYVGLMVPMCVILLPISVSTVLFRRKTREWFLRAKRIRAEYKKAQPGLRRSSSRGHFFK